MTDETLLGTLVRTHIKFSLHGNTEKKVRLALGPVLADQPISFYRDLFAKDPKNGTALEAYITDQYPNTADSANGDAMMLSEEVFQWLNENKPQVNGKAKGTPDFLPYFCH